MKTNDQAEPLATKVGRFARNSSTIFFALLKLGIAIGIVLLGYWIMKQRSNCRISWAKIIGKERFCTGCSEARLDLEEDGDETEIHRTQSFVHTASGQETNICFDEDGDLINLDKEGPPFGNYKKKKMKYKEFKDCIGNKSKCG